MDPTGENPLVVIIGLYFLLGDDWLNAPTTIDEEPKSGMTPMNELGLCLIGGNWYKTGKELKIGDNIRLAPFGNRTGHPTGRYPHYHRRPKPNENNQVPRGQGISRHRPLDKSPDDKSFWDRF